MQEKGLSFKKTKINLNNGPVFEESYINNLYVHYA